MSIEDYIENSLKRMFAKYILLVMKPSGIIFRRYFWYYEDMEDYSIMCQFTPNVVYAKGLTKKDKKLVTLFTIDSSKKK